MMTMRRRPWKSLFMIILLIIDKLTPGILEIFHASMWGNQNDLLIFFLRNWLSQQIFKDGTVANFSARCYTRNLVRDLIKCGNMEGISIENPFDVFEGNPQWRQTRPLVRVEKMFPVIQSKLPGTPQFLLCRLS